MLRRTAALTGKVGVMAFAKMMGIDQKKMHYEIEGAGPLFDYRGLLLQLGKLSRIEVGAMAQPDVEVALLRIRYRAAAAHQKQRVDVVARQGLALIVESHRDFLGGQQRALAGPVIRNAQRPAG